MAATFIPITAPVKADIPTAHPLPLPQILTYPSSTPPQLITQGAEALLFKTTYLTPSISCALKYRPSKPYRHRILDVRLTKHRILSEARVLVKCRKEGVPVPAVYGLDIENDAGNNGVVTTESVETRGGGWIALEWIEGEVVRIRINEFLARRKEAGDMQAVSSEGGPLLRLMGRIGAALARMHAIGIVHGDLTTSNLMLRQDSGTNIAGDAGLDGEVVLIDFGLASQTTADEDRAVDLYVLERAFGSTHPRAEGLFSEVLRVYGQSFKGGNVVLKKLEGVRMRGRKRSMLG